MSNDKRRYVRVKDSVQVKYRVLSGIVQTDSYCVDISEGGLRLPVFQKLERGALVEISVYLSKTEEPVVITGKVMWIKEEKRADYRFVAGVQFLKTNVPERDKIIAHLIKAIAEKENE
ncbi:MAG: PilZ domain-containing protein [Candidatus Omnitrophica bacterium]|nr:PilZ domain-containing protein [Candidatus Omnitrophota bacterium]